jgi:hypothetical protein
MCQLTLHELLHLIHNHFSSLHYCLLLRLQFSQAIHLQRNLRQPFTQTLVHLHTLPRIPIYKHVRISANCHNLLRIRLFEYRNFIRNRACTQFVHSKCEFDDFGK